MFFQTDGEHSDLDNENEAGPGVCSILRAYILATEIT